MQLHCGLIYGIVTLSELLLRKINAYNNFPFTSVTAAHCLEVTILVGATQVRLNTRLLYQQTKFNLLREESEGYAKLVRYRRSLAFIYCRSFCPLRFYALFLDIIYFCFSETHLKEYPFNFWKG